MPIWQQGVPRRLVQDAVMTEHVRNIFCPREEFPRSPVGLSGGKRLIIRRGLREHVIREILRSCIARTLILELKQHRNYWVVSVIDYPTPFDKGGGGSERGLEYHN